MTINATPRRAGPFLGDGINTSFPFGFKVFGRSDVRLTMADIDGIETTLQLDSEYTIALNVDQEQNPGGTVTYPIAGAPLPNGYRIVVTGSLPNDQPTSITNQGGFYPRVVEDALDRLAIQIQQMQEQLSRTLQASVSGDFTVDDIIAQLEEQLPYVTAVYAELNQVIAVANNETNINTVAASTGAVTTVAGDLGGTWATGVMYDFGMVTDPPIGNTSPPGGNIVLVASNITDVGIVASNIANVTALAPVANDIQNVSQNMGDIQAVLANEANINAVVANELNINTVSGDIANVNTVASNNTNLNTVASNIADVQVVSSISTDVTTVANNEVAVVAVGNDLTGQPIVIDYGDLAPATNPATPSGVLGAVWANAANIAAVAGEIAAVVYVSQNLAAILDALAGALRPSNNLSDLDDPVMARANLGLADLGGLT